MTADLDLDRVRGLLSVVSESVGLLREVAELSLSELSGDKHKQGSAKYHFITAIEGAIDLASHCISRGRLRAPETYGDAFVVLAEAGVIDSAFSQELVKMARFRNRLVHRYWEIDLEQLHQILRERLTDIERFARTMMRHARMNGSQP